MQVSTTAGGTSASSISTMEQSAIALQKRRNQWMFAFTISRVIGATAGRGAVPLRQVFSPPDVCPETTQTRPLTSALGCERELMKRFSSSGMSRLSSNSPERPTRDCTRPVCLGPLRPIQFQDLISCRPPLKTTRIGVSYTAISWYVASASFRTPPPSPRPSRFLPIDSM